MHESAVADRAGIAAGGNGGGMFAGDWRGGEGGRSQTPRRAYVTGMLIALSAIAMFFVAMVSAAEERKRSHMGVIHPMLVLRAL